MRGYGQFCPVAKAAEVLAERWTPLILRELLCGSTRFNELQRGVPLMSRSLLSKRLRQLEGAGIVEHRDGEYVLTESGEALRPIVMSLGEWGATWLRTQVTSDDLDPRLLMWDMRRRIHLDAVPGGRTVVNFEFPDVPRASLRRTWLILDPPSVDVCYKDPGFEVDLVCRTSIGLLVGVWRGEVSLRDAIASGDATLDGPRDLREAFPGWLQLSVFAGV